MNKQSNSPFQTKPKKKAPRAPQNFVEALKSIGGSTVKSVKKDLVSGTAQGMVDSLTGQFPQQTDNNRENMDFSQEWLMQKEQDLEKQSAQREQHKKIIEMQPVYDRRKQETEAKIKQIHEELKKLAQEIKDMEKGISKAVQEEVVNPGTYHLNFFEKLRQFIVFLRKKASESKNWLAISQQRKQAQRAYDTGRKTSGTKFTLSSERQVATSIG